MRKEFDVQMLYLLRVHSVALTRTHALKFYWILVEYAEILGCKNLHYVGFLAMEIKLKWL